MGEAADDLTDAGLDAYTRHLNGECLENECPYCAEEHWLKGDN